VREGEWGEGGTECQFQFESTRPSSVLKIGCLRLCTLRGNGRPRWGDATVTPDQKRHPHYGYDYRRWLSRRMLRHHPRDASETEGCQDTTL